MADETDLILDDRDWRLLELLATERGKRLGAIDVDPRLVHLGLVKPEPAECAVWKLTRAGWCLLMLRAGRSCG